MQRLIKFRAWDGEKMDRCWKDGRLVIDASTGEAQKIGYGSAPFNISIPHGLTLMQYTGLKDRNGVEIYEGDILSSPSMPISPVEFQRGSFNAVYADGSHDEWEAPLWRYSVEVIGNIYENPELLEANQ